MATYIDDNVPGTAASNHIMAKKTTTGGASFTPLEDEAIAKAWIAAAEDPIVGAEQKGNDFLTKIQQLYNSKFKPANRVDRTTESVRTRCKTVHKQCMLFSGCHARIRRPKPTGVSPNDMIKMATALYNGVQIDNIADDSGKPFKFEIAWRVLRHHAKFFVASDDSRTTTAPEPTSTSPEKWEKSGASMIENGADDDAGTTLHNDRPMGRKRTKDMKKREEETTKKLPLSAELVEAQRERSKALKRHYEIMLFTQAPAGCDNNDAVEYFRIMRARALSELRRETPNSALLDTGDEEQSEETNALQS